MFLDSFRDLLELRRSQLHLGTMYLGILVLLLKPLLMKAVNILCCEQRQDASQDDQINHLAWTW